ncbi:MAG: hypothetical protein ACOYL6_12760 [Bacteriovoracaceae bacterium]
MKMPSAMLVMAMLATGCATYHHADNMKLVSFSDNATKGESVGNIRGEDCTWSFFGYKMGGDPTLDKAFINAKNQAGALESAGFTTSNDKHSNAIRYINNVSTENDGFNAGVVAKQCLIVKGVGYR